ncbi:MAG TPA: LPS assembly lipoprotein LptE [Rhodanobacteraceae bacterium]|nr:LPS assembly lipoprotein LptE [Rhodanobacteraceae bacterium]
MKIAHCKLGPALACAGMVLFVSLLGGCGFHLRSEARLPASMQRVHVEIADRFSPLARDLEKALGRSGAEVVDTVEPGVAVMKFTANSISTDVQSVGGNARANEYVIRHHVEFDVEDAAGTLLLPKQVIELSRDFTFDASQALGIAAEQDVLTRELERDMVQTILRRLEALARAPH